MPKRRLSLIPLVFLFLFACGSPSEGHQPNRPLLTGAVPTPQRPTVDEPDRGGQTDPPETVDVRVVAANLSSGNYQSYDPGHGNRILQGVKPDVVLVQELNYDDNSPEAIRSWVDDVFGPDFHYYRETGAQIPNGVVSRWPILSAGAWEDPYVSNRDLVWARIDLPGDRELFAVSVHFLTSGAQVRDDQAETLVAEILEHAPADDFLLVGGDLNTRHLDEYCLSTLEDLVVTDGAVPEGLQGNIHTNQPRNKPYDHVLAGPDLDALQVPTELEVNSFPHGLIVDTRIHEPLSEIAPAQEDDSAAFQMQHMAVVKDYRLPVAE